MSWLEELMERGELDTALIVAKNAFNRAPGDEKAFIDYFDLLCELAEQVSETAPELAERDMASAETALAFFSENTDLNESRIDYIESCRTRLSTLCDKLNELADAREQAERSAQEGKNAAALANLQRQIQELGQARDQKTFSEMLVKTSAIDKSLVQEAFTPEQRATYDVHTKELSRVIEEQMKTLARAENVAYNKQAVEAFHLVLKQFHADEARYTKSANELRALVNENLFGHDTTRLFPETLTYYQHVYGYIFSKLDDEGKFALTRLSIDCAKLRR